MKRSDHSPRPCSRFAFRRRPASSLFFLATAALLSLTTAVRADVCTICDVNGNNLVDQADLLAFAACKTSPTLPIITGCERLDLDLDGDIDQDDFGIFQNCLAAAVMPTNPVISEFMASNSTTLADENGDYPDWIEIYNPENATINLKDWYLTDSATNLTKWKIPEVYIAGGGYLIVFASDKNRATAGQPLHTNFKLDAEGEYLALVQPDGATIACEYAPKYPVQSTDVSYGMDMTIAETHFVGSGSDCRAVVPTAAPLPINWCYPGFDDSVWLTGTSAVGYERASGYESLIGLDVGAGMYGINSTALIRLPFMLIDPNIYAGLTLTIRYDDGFAAYLNGQFVTQVNAPATLDWNSGATADHPDVDALVPAVIDITDRLGYLVSGKNVLAIQGLNNGSGSSDFLIDAQLTGLRARVIQPRTDRILAAPTPGWANGSIAANAGPEVTAAQFTPASPTDTQDLTVTVHVTAATNPVASVTMYYRVMFGTETAVTMLDDGAHGDGAAGDGVYGASIPASASTPGQMVRWYVVATDNKALTTRLPKYASANGSVQYFGTVVADPAVVTQLPLLQWFVQDPAAAQTDNGTRASVFYLGRFYDNVKAELRGDTSSGWPKKNFKFHFNSGDYFVFMSDLAPVDEINLNSTYSDKSYMRQVLASETYRTAGTAAPIAFPVRVQQNAAFYSVAIMLEEPEEEFLKRVGLDPDGALYKMANSCDTVSGAEKKTREDEGTEDLQALINGLALSGSARNNYLFDNVDIPACINYLAATTLMHDNDHIGKNYYVYRKSEGSGEWQMLPWDKDLTFGRNFDCANGVINDTIWADFDPYSHPLFGDSGHPKCDGPWNRFINALHNTAVNNTYRIRSMYARRLRTLMDAQLQAPGTAYAQLKYEARIDQLIAQMQPDVTLDRAKWGNMYGANQDLVAATDIMKNQYLAVRRTHLYVTHAAANGGIIPTAQPANAAIAFGTIEHSPASGNQDEEYVELKNTNTYAVDISGWQFQVYDDTNSLWEEKHTFRPGTVLRANSSLYATPKATAFRARTVSPKGGEGRFIQGNYDHHIAPGEKLRIVNTAGTVVATATAGS